MPLGAADVRARQCGITGAAEAGPPAGAPSQCTCRAAAAYEASSAAECSTRAARRGASQAQEPDPAAS